MKKAYEKPTITTRDVLSDITAITISGPSKPAQIPDAV
jgi:hypothetical protein